jgi:hypothetical protein
VFMTRAHWLGAGVLSVVMMSGWVFAQSPVPPNHDHAASAAQGNGGRAGTMPMDHQKMMSDIAAEDAKLQEMVSGMNAATGDDKVKAIADLVTRLVTDLKNEHQHMMEMHNQMMPGK